MNIKKGDKVRLIKKDSSFGWEKSLKVGKTYIVSHVRLNNYIPVIRVWVSKDFHWGLPARCFKLARAIDEQLLFPFMYDSFKKKGIIK